MVVFGAFIMYKIIHIQYVEGDKWREMAKEISTKVTKVKAVRGNILASDLSFLAVSIPVYELRMDPMAEAITKDIFNEHVDSLSHQLSILFKDKTKEKYKKLIVNARKEKNRYLLIQKNVSVSDVDKVMRFPIFRLGKNKGGLIKILSSKRIKPYGNLASRTIGKEAGESQGLGIEFAYDEFLRGEEGMRIMERIGSNMWRPIDSENTIEPVDGFDVYTTIDPRIQDVAHSELERQLKMHNAGYGCVLLMEVSTGDVKAIANLKKSDDGNYYESYNYAIGEATEPGSTFKLATIISLLEEGFIQPDDMIETGNGKLPIYNHVLEDSHEGGYGTISIQKAFEVSSNVAMAKLVQKHYGNNPDQYINYLKKFHLDKPLEIGIPGEAKPRIKQKTDKDWSGLTLPMMSIGYESLITPLQIATLYNAIANNGKMMRPRFVYEIRSRGSVIKQFPTSVLEEKICSEQTVKACRKMMEGVVLNGTAKNLSKSVYQIAGKTGTAQVATGNKGYRSPSGIIYKASFCGYFPADNPKYTCIVVVNAPSNKVYYGNVVAGPIFKAVADKIYASSFDINQDYHTKQIAEINLPNVINGYADDISSLLQELKVSVINQSPNDFVKTKTEGNKIVFQKQKMISQSIPDLKGMGLKDAMYLIDQLGLRVKVTGKGIVREQSIIPGSNVQQGEEIHIKLS
jgi:cell division protein FtsI (penicillin-binding protein 3)